MIGYVAKDRNEEIYLHREKPTYDDELEGWYSDYGMINITNVIGQFSEFDNISYTDEPIKVEIKFERI